MSRLHSFGLSVAAWLLRLLVTLLLASYRWSRDSAGDGERLEEILRQERPVIFVGWHSQAFFLTKLLHRYVRHGLRTVTLASHSRDGELAARFARRMGAFVVRGSSSRGGSAGLRQLHRAMSRGRSGILLADGPRGPRYEVKPGTVLLARLTGAPILPLGFAARRGWTFRSWDRLCLPKPFTTLSMVVGEPIEVPRKLTRDDLETRRRQLEAELLRLGGEARRRCAPPDRADRADRADGPPPAVENVTPKAGGGSASRRLR